MPNQLMGGGDETKLHLLAGFDVRDDEGFGSGARGAAGIGALAQRFLMAAASMMAGWDMGGNGRAVLRRQIERRVD